MNIKKERLTKLIGVLIIFVIISNFIPTKYFIMSPGIAQELSPMVTVEKGNKNGSQGDFMLTAVASQRATLWDLIYIKVSKPVGVELEAMEEQLPPGMDMSEYLQIMNQLMEESQLQAQAVAFKKAGYDIVVKGEGAEVVEVLSGGSAEGILKSGDIIIEIDGQPVQFSSDAVQLIRKHKIGDNVNIKVTRDNEIFEYTLKTVDMESSPGKASIGVLITTKGLDYNFPLDVTFNTGNIGGPSAGSMFTLEIYNQLIKEDLTKGKRIAGTGTISLDGSIGKIDGVIQKVLAAKREKADLFLVPKENYEEAKKVARGIILVKVENIDQAIEYLKNN